MAEFVECEGLERRACSLCGDCPMTRSSSRRGLCWACYRKLGDAGLRARVPKGPKPRTLAETWRMLLAGMTPEHLAGIADALALELEARRGP